MTQELKTIGGIEYVVISPKDLLIRYQLGKENELGHISLDGIPDLTPIFIHGDHNELEGKPLQKINLTRANLQNISLRGANLRGANLIEVYARNLNLRGANLSGANLRGANLSGAFFQYTDLNGANLSGANLSLASLYSIKHLGNTIFDSSTIFKDCKLTPSIAQELNQITQYYQQS